MKSSKTRTDQIATPDAVFAACDHLKRTQGSFSNQDVLAITKGGMSTVSRLVKIYRAHEAIIESNHALDGRATIELVGAIDALLEKQITTSGLALTRFEETIKEELAALCSDLDEAHRQLDDKDAHLDEKETKINEAQKRGYELEQKVQSIDRELIEARSQIHVLRDEQAHTVKAYEAKLDRLIAKNQQDMAVALENQRKAIEAEKTAYIEKLNEAHHLRMSETQKKIDSLTTESQAEKQLLMQDNIRLQEAVVTAKREAELLSKKAEATELELRALLEDKKAAIDEAQRLNRELLNTISHQLEVGSEDVAVRLNDVSNAAMVLGGALTDIKKFIQEVQNHSTAKR